MSYNDKIRRAREITEAHNSNVPKENQIDFEANLEKLRNAGGTTIDALKHCRFEDIESFGWPNLLARQVAAVWREENGGGDTKSAYVSEKKAKQLSRRELLGRYDPKDADNPVGERLSQISEGKRCIVFRGAAIDVGASVTLLDEIRDGYPERDMYVVAGSNDAPRQVYKVGDRPDRYADKNPLYKGRVLRPDQSCDQTNRSWEGVSLGIRQVVYLAVRETHELKVASVVDAHNAMDLALNIPEKLRQRCPKAVLKLSELQKVGSAPTLKIPINQTGVDRERRNDPFPAHKQF